MQNGHVEWLIGSIRRESLDHLIMFGEAHLRHILKAYSSNYNEIRTHLSLDKDAPEFWRTQEDRPHRCDTNPRRALSSIRPGLGSG
jgi:hypothetical protein